MNQYNRNMKKKKLKKILKGYKICGYDMSFYLKHCDEWNITLYLKKKKK
jgi:hypothetical protein